MSDAQAVQFFLYGMEGFWLPFSVRRYVRHACEPRYSQYATGRVLILEFAF